MVHYIGVGERGSFFQFFKDIKSNGHEKRFPTSFSAKTTSWPPLNGQDVERLRKMLPSRLLGI